MSKSIKETKKEISEKTNEKNPKIYRETDNKLTNHKPTIIKITKEISKISKKNASETDTYDSNSDTENNTKSNKEGEDEDNKEENSEENYCGREIYIILSPFGDSTFYQFIIKDNIIRFNDKSILCYFYWSGIAELERWELNRKVIREQVIKIYKSMKSDYKTKGNFTFYEPVHLAMKKDNICYVIDGQHRLLACNELCKKNKYPIQRIPCILWFPDDEDDFIEIFDKINTRTPMDKNKLFNYKIKDINKWLEQKYGDIWGKLRPKINKDTFVEKMRENEYIHKMETLQIIECIEKINIGLRKLPRNKRCVGASLTESIHNKAEDMDFFLGYDKEMNWIYDVRI